MEGNQSVEWKEILRLQKNWNAGRTSIKASTSLSATRRNHCYLWSGLWRSTGLIEEEVQVKESEGNSSFFKMMEKRSIIASIKNKSSYHIWYEETSSNHSRSWERQNANNLCKSCLSDDAKQVDEERILMITFTRNAANELKTSR